MQHIQANKRIAVIGAGVAGIVASYLLQDRHHVTLFEKEPRLGGHTNTVLVDSSAGQIPIDTGFIVLNDKTYPLMHRFLSRLQVPWRWSNMSFGYYDENSGLQYAGTGFSGLFAQPRNFFSPRFVKMLFEIRRFSTAALKALEQNESEMTLGSFFSKHKFPEALVRDYVVPIGAAIWSAPHTAMLEFPAITFFRFFKNHGLLSLKDRPRWQTVVGGSHSYLKKFEETFAGRVRKNAAIRSVSRGESGVVLRFEDNSDEQFDAVIFATHADQSLKLLADPSKEERELLGSWSYQRNYTVLHSDRSFLPPLRRAWASWNYRREKGQTEDSPISVTYHMNRLQGISGPEEYCVTLNPKREISKERVIREIEYTHPVFSQAAIRSQESLSNLNGVRNTWFCGSYFGYGFHEDAIASGVRVAQSFGAEL